MSLHDDAVQLEAWAKEIWGKGIDCCNAQANATTHDGHVEGMDPSKLTQEDWMKALSLLLFLKEKQSGKINGRACINVSPQQAYIPK
jgi:hypothetical protein